MPQPSFGLCDRCAHQRLVRNTRGSTFSLCERSKEDESFPRYPRVPVLECRGYEPRPEADAEADADADATDTDAARRASTS
jgi:hypothetical protein